MTVCIRNNELSNLKLKHVYGAEYLSHMSGFVGLSISRVAEMLNMIQVKTG